MSNVCISRKSGPKRGPSRPTRAQPPKRGGHYHDDTCSTQTGHHQHLEVQQVQQRWTMRNANGEDGWGKMYVFFWYFYYYFIYSCSFTAGRAWRCCHHPRKVRLTVRHCRQRQWRVKCTLMYVLFFLFHIFLFFYSRKRMVLLPSPSKGMPESDSPPLSSTTTAGKMYVFSN